MLLEESVSEPVFLFSGDDPRMTAAYTAAQHAFKFFWRELSWERRRIIPGLGIAMIKLPFTDGPRTDGNPEFEHMWCNEVEFDGQQLTATLINSPNWLSSVQEGDRLQRPLSHLTDWLITAEGAAYGGFTVNLMRAEMSAQERQAHDAAWGLDFGDPRQIRMEIERGEKGRKGLFAGLFQRRDKHARGADPEQTFHDHPMCLNMLAKIEAQLQADPSITRSVDEGGWTLLHHEALAGNLGVVRLLVQYGADAKASTPDGKDAASLARAIGWEAIATYLVSEAGAAPPAPTTH